LSLYAKAVKPASSKDLLKDLTRVLSNSFIFINHFKGIIILKGSSIIIPSPSSPKKSSSVELSWKNHAEFFSCRIIFFLGLKLCWQKHFCVLFNNKVNHCAFVFQSLLSLDYIQNPVRLSAMNIVACAIHLNIRELYICSTVR